MTAELSTQQRIERDLLGIVLRDSEQAADVLQELISPADFEDPRHRAIYQAAVDLWRAGRHSTPGLVARRLEEGGNKLAMALMDGDGGLIAWRDSAPAFRAAPGLARTLREGRVGRDATEALSAALSRLKAGESPEAVLDRVKRELGELEVDGAQGGPEEIGAVVKRHVRDMSLEQEAGKLPGVPTGIRAFDEAMGTLKPRKMYVIAARPGIGKTSLAMSFLRGASLARIPSLLFSLEMSKEEIAERVVSDHADVAGHLLANRMVDRERWRRIMSCVPRVSEMPITLDDRMLTMPQIAAASRIWRARHQGLAVIAVDYIGLIKRTERGQNRAVEVAEWSGQLKALAKTLSVPVLVLAQLNRDLEKREGKRPQLSDLRESGAIEQDADCVIFPHREGVPEDSQESEDAELIVCKHRGGPLGSVPVSYWRRYTRFTDRAMREPATF